jgi:hypothetical protein
MISQNIYTSTDGTTWSMITDWLNVPAERVIPADLAVKRASLGLTDARLVKAFEEIEADLNTGNIINAYSKFDQLKKRVADIPDEALLMDIACVFALLPDEDPFNYKPSLNARKLQIWQEDIDCRFFFIQKAVHYITNLSHISDDVIRMLIQQRDLMESADQSKTTIFPLSETGLMSS